MLESINNIKNLSSNNFILIAGPCVVESAETTIEIAEHINKITQKLKIPFIFKASYKKANRTSIKSFTGIGDELALSILYEIKTKYKIPVITDIHSVKEAEIASKYVDVLQIPAFLSRQTELLVAAANTGKVVNIKKGQFLSPNSVKHIINKIQNINKSIMITDRGSMFGYHDLIVDFRSIPIMKKNGFPVILDVTHSLQKPNQDSGITGGDPEMISTIAKAGIAVGVDGIFLETHPNPQIAKSDGENMLKLDKLENLLCSLIKIRKAIL